MKNETEPMKPVQVIAPQPAEIIPIPVDQEEISRMWRDTFQYLNLK